MLYEENLWGRVNELHLRYKRQNQNLENLIYMFTQFQNVLYYYGRDLTKAVDKNYKLFEEQNTTQNHLLLQLMRNFKIQGEIFSNKYEEMNQNITEQYKKIFKNIYSLEDEYYNNFTNSKKAYEKIKEKLETYEKNYISSLQKVEEKTIEYMKNKLNNEDEEELIENENELENFFKRAKNSENEYYNNVEKANTLRINYNENQTLYLQNYQRMNNEIGNNIRNSILSYLTDMKQIIAVILSDLDLLSDKIRKLDINNDDNEFINSYKSNLKPEERIIFHPYKPKTKLNHDSLNPILDYEVIKIMKNKLNFIFLDFNEEIEKEKIDLRMILSKLFNYNKILDDEDKIKLKEYLNKEENRNFFLTSLSNQRKNGKYLRKKEIIEEITIILMEILGVSEKEKDFQSAKNCIILSQTFYYEEDNKKMYIDNKLKLNNWMKSIDFWKGVIGYMIETEIDRQKSTEVNIKNESEEDKEKKISMIVFTQLITYCQVMLDFEIDKNNIVEILNLFIEKYKIDKELSSQIYGTIGME